MRTTTRRTAALAVALAAATALSACSSTDNITTGSVSQPMDSVVKVVTAEGGHGSGFHIGGGYIITAAHVVVGGPYAEMRDEAGGTLVGTVLWSNKDYDVALLRVPDSNTYGTAKLDCRTPTEGEAIVARGNPGREDFVAVRGHIAGNLRPATPNWKEVVVADLSATGGISGGPVYAADGRVVGIVVGGMVAALKRTADPKGLQDYDLSQSGLSYVVPASTICNLMAVGAGGEVV